MQRHGSCLLDVTVGQLSLLFQGQQDDFCVGVGVQHKVLSHHILSQKWQPELLSSIALAWNYLFNAIFERWESRQTRRGRSFARRMVHGAGFEGGLAVILVPVMALWLNISALNAFLANIGLLAFFFVYAIAFTWTFDRVFGLPASAQKRDDA